MRPFRKQRAEITEVFRKRHHEVVRFGVGNRPRQQFARLIMLAQHLISRRSLDSDMQRDKRVMQPLAGRQQSVAPAYDLGVRALSSVILF